MDKLDQMIKEYLMRERAARHVSDRPGVYPALEDLYHFLMDELEGENLERMLSHLQSHPEDQRLVAQARRLLEKESESQNEHVPDEWIDKAKGLMPGKSSFVRCPHCGKPITPFKRPRSAQRLWNLAWLLGGAASFLLSFAVRRYFFQFLAAALLFGVKWIVDQKAAKTQVLIYKALQEGETNPRLKDLHKTSPRL